MANVNQHLRKSAELIAMIQVGAATPVVVEPKNFQ